METGAEPRPSSPERVVELALVRLAAAKKLDPVSDEEIAAALPQFEPDQLTLLLSKLIQDDITRRLPEGWVLRSHGPRFHSSRNRLLLPDAPRVPGHTMTEIESLWSMDGAEPRLRSG